RKRSQLYYEHILASTKILSSEEEYRKIFLGKIIENLLTRMTYIEEYTKELSVLLEQNSELAKINVIFKQYGLKFALKKCSFSKENTSSDLCIIDLTSSK